MASNSSRILNPCADASRPIVVYGAAGHTGRFVIAELRRRGRPVILAGRDSDKLKAAADGANEFELRTAAVEDADSLDHALAGAAAILNCAGPFADTAEPLIKAAIRATIPYFDVASEPQLIVDVFNQYHEPAKQAGIVVAQGLAFFGGFGDLLATAAMGNWSEAEEICIAIALDSWNPTPATRATGRFNVGKRRFLSDGKLELLGDPPPTRNWSFPSPWGSQPMIGFPSGEVIMLARHLRVRNVQSYINLAPIKDIRDPKTPPPSASDESGRSAQTFLIDVIVRKDSGEERRAMAQGRDAYAVTAPILVEAAQRILDGRAIAAGVIAAGAVFDARELLRTLSPHHFTLRLLD
jgi:hypothetical protein